MNFTAKDVAALREKTGCGMMDCKKALTEADGNAEKAVEILRANGEDAYIIGEIIKSDEGVILI